VARYAPVTAVLQFFGREAEALRDNREFREKALHRKWPRTEWVDRLLDYDAGMISADELPAATGPSRLNRCEAHYFIGLTRLANADRDGARDQFLFSVPGDPEGLGQVQCRVIRLQPMDGSPEIKRVALHIVVLLKAPGSRPPVGHRVVVRQMQLACYAPGSWPSR
jgi:hypothetical protein